MMDGWMEGYQNKEVLTLKQAVFVVPVRGSDLLFRSLGERWRIALEKHSEQSYTHCVRHLGAPCAGLEERLRTHRHRLVVTGDA